MWDADNTGACVINNGGPAPDDDSDDSGDDNDEQEMVPNQKVIIEEVNEDEEAGEDEQEEDPVQAEYERNVAVLKAENDDELWEGTARETLFSEDVNHVELFHAAHNDGNQGQESKEWMKDATGNASLFSKRENGESSTSNEGRSMRGASDTEDEKDQGVGHSEQRGVVGPEPPLPP